MSTTLTGINLPAVTGNLIQANAGNWNTIAVGTGGQVLLSNGTNPTWTTLSGSVTSVSPTGVVAIAIPSVVVNRGASYPILASETGTNFTNNTAAGPITYTLPAAPTPGLNYTFIVASPLLLTVTGNAVTELIATNNATIATTGQTIRTNAQYSTLRVLAISSTIWQVTTVVGPWIVL